MKSSSGKALKISDLINKGWVLKSAWRVKIACSQNDAGESLNLPAKCAPRCTRGGRRSSLVAGTSAPRPALAAGLVVGPVLFGRQVGRLVVLRPVSSSQVSSRKFA